MGCRAGGRGHCAWGGGRGGGTPTPMRALRCACWAAALRCRPTEPGGFGLSLTIFSRCSCRLCNSDSGLCQPGATSRRVSARRRMGGADPATALLI